MSDPEVNDLRDRLEQLEARNVALAIAVHALSATHPDPRRLLRRLDVATEAFLGGTTPRLLITSRQKQWAREFLEHLPVFDPDFRPTRPDEL